MNALNPSRLITLPPLQRGWSQTLCAVATGLLLALPYLDRAWYGLSWLAFVPLLWAIDGASLRRAYGLGLLAGLAFYLTAAPWIVNFLVLFKGYAPLPSFLASLVFWFYCAQLPALLVLSLVSLRRFTHLPVLWLFPLLVVLFYGFFPMLFSVQLGESQSAFITAVQPIELTGVYGLDFMIALVNALLVSLLTGGVARRPIAHAAAVVCVGAWFVYGTLVLDQWRNRIATWDTKTIGLVQPNERPSLGEPRVQPGYAWGYPAMMATSEKLATQGADLIVWPEARYLRYFDQPHVAAAFRHHVADMATPVLFQDMETVEARDGDTGYYNTATLIDAGGTDLGQYRKIKRVAFGERLPVVQDIPWLAAALETYFGDFYQNILPGQGPVGFQLTDMQVVPLICYETLFPRFTARALEGRVQGALLAGLSSDGWFGYSAQPFQHLFTSSLRAVENRVPMVHVLNNGPSGVILPTGEFVTTTPMDEAGGYLAELPFSVTSGGSFFNRYPYSFVGLVTAVLLISGLIGALRRTTFSIENE